MTQSTKKVQMYKKCIHTRQLKHPYSGICCRCSWNQTAYQMFQGPGIVMNMDKSTFQYQYYPTTSSIAKYPVYNIPILVSFEP